MVTVDIITNWKKRESLKHKNKMTQIWSVSLISFVGCRKSNKTKKKRKKSVPHLFFCAGYCSSGHSLQRLEQRETV